jgi:hypothetical protein
MKLEIIETFDYILAVSDEEIKEGDLFTNNRGQISKCVKSLEEWLTVNKSEIRKVVAYQPKGNVKKLDLPLLPEIVVEDDVEKLAENYKNKKGSIPTTELEDEIFKLGFKDGYKAATKVYSEGDLRKAIEMARKGIIFYSSDITTLGPLVTDDEIIQSLKQPKTPKWFVAETTSGGEYLAGEVGGNEIWAEYPKELKVTIISGKEHLVGKFKNE